MCISIKGAASLLSVMALAVSSIATADEVGVTKDTIKIGVFGPMTGAAALFGKSVFGIESVYKDINDKWLFVAYSSKRSDRSSDARSFARIRWPNSNVAALRMRETRDSERLRIFEISLRRRSSLWYSVMTIRDRGSRDSMASAIS